MIFYTKGLFVKDFKLRYEGVDIYAYNGQDTDYWSFFETHDLIKVMDSLFNVDCVKIWWKQEVGSLEKYLKPFRNYEDASLLYLFVEMEKEHVIEENCMTDELDSGANEDSCDDKLILIRFNEEEPVTKDFTLRLKSRFSALKQFKKDILQYCVLNGVHVRFAKNDFVRCRVICKHKKICSYTILCNMVIRNTSFNIKTLFHKYKCGRQFFNKSIKDE